MQNICLVTALALVLNTASRAQSEPAARKWSITGDGDPRLASFDAEMHAYMTEHAVSAGALAVVKDGRLVLSRGYTRAPAGEPQTQPHSLFRIASLSKPLTAVGILRLVDDGRLRLDQRVATILDMDSWSDGRARQITIRQLLQHRGGFDRDKSFDPMFIDRRISAALGRPLPTDPQMVIDFMASQQLDFAPGERYAYSNFGYCLLGRIIEKVSGLDYEDYMLREVLRPIGAGGMRIGGTLRDERLAGEVAYDAEGSRRSVMGSDDDVPIPYGCFNVPTMDAHGGWVASAADLARFLTAFDDADESPLLSPGSVEEMWARPAGHGPEPVHYGLGWLVRRLPSGKINTWHGGSLPGTWTLMVRRHDGLSWVALFNRRGPGSGAIDGALHRAANAVEEWPEHDLFGN